MATIRQKLNFHRGSVVGLWEVTVVWLDKCTKDHGSAVIHHPIQLMIGNGRQAKLSFFQTGDHMSLLAMGTGFVGLNLGTRGQRVGMMRGTTAHILSQDISLNPPSPSPARPGSWAPASLAWSDSGKNQK